ncbi:hypothetical protein CJF30_00004068 [Rutstroemia sp. NJR-2017a BBW]|nr:hypothetical protein CJF30_00004068 [Rutstroemia sp. NJR-2017a BBW]
MPIRHSVVPIPSPSPCKVRRLCPMSDRASKALAEASLPGEPRTYGARSKRSGVPLTTIYHRDHGRRSKEKKAQGQQYLTPSEEKALEKYLKLIADLGNPVRIKYLPSLAFSIARQRSTTDKATKPPNKNWAQAFQKRHPALKSRRVRAMAWERHENNIYDKITYWFEVVGKVLLEDPAILLENVYNMDETGVMLCMLGSIKVLISKDDPRDYRGAGVKRTMVTAIECISASATGPRSTPLDGTMHAPNLEFCFENNIILCRLPSHTSHKLQPCDVGVFGPLKEAYRDEADRLFRGGANTVGKQHFTSLYSPAREKALTKRNIMKAWAACGLFPFNPDRVLRVTPKPPAQSTVPRADEIKVGSCHQDEVPQTPVTPVSAEGLASLHNLIKQDAYRLDGTSTQRLERHVQKLANAAQISFAERALLYDQNQMLTRMNNEAKVRRSTRSIVLGKAKVMSFEDIEVARAARAVKEVIKGKGKRGRKRKSAAQQADEPEPEPEVALIIDAPVLWRAPVARMI